MPVSAEDRWSIQLDCLTRTDIVRFAGAGGDFNPNHHDEPHARANGYPGVFAMGLFTASFASRLIDERFPDTMVRSFAVRFRAMVWPGEALIAHAVRVPGEAHRVEIEVVNAGGEVKLSGTADIGPRAISESPAAPPPPPPPVPSPGGALNDRVGEVVRAFVFPIEIGKVMEFSRAMTARDVPANYAALGDQPIRVPLTFSVAAAHYAGGDATALPIALGLDLARTVHGEQRWDYYGPLRAGTVISGRTAIAAVERKVGRAGEMLLVTTRTDFRDEHGVLLQSESMTSVEMPAR